MAALIEAKSKRFHRSLGDFSSQSTEPLPSPAASDVPLFPLTPSRSLHNLAFRDLPPPPPPPPPLSPPDEMWGYNSAGESSNSGDRRVSAERRRLEAELQRVQTELRLAKDRVSQLETAPVAQEKRLFGVEPAEGGGRVSAEISEGVARFNRLFSEQRLPLLAVLETLPELKGAQDLQMKILITVVIVSLCSRSLRLVWLHCNSFSCLFEVSRSCWRSGGRKWPAPWS